MKKLFLSASLLIYSSQLYAPTYDVEWIVNASVGLSGQRQGGIVVKREICLSHGDVLSWEQEGHAFSLDYRRHSVIHARVCDNDPLKKCDVLALVRRLLGYPSGQNFYYRVSNGKVGEQGQQEINFNSEEVKISSLNLKFVK